MSIVNKLQNTEDPHLAVHEFSAIMLGWLLDDFTSAQARGAVESHFEFTLSAGEITELTDIRTEFDSRSADGQNRYWHQFEAYATLLQGGLLTGAQFRNLMGIT